MADIAMIEAVTTIAVASGSNVDPAIIGSGLARFADCRGGAFHSPQTPRHTGFAALPPVVDET